MKPKDACFSILNLRVHPQVQTSVPVTKLITGYTLTQLITGYVLQTRIFDTANYRL